MFSLSRKFSYFEKHSIAKFLWPLSLRKFLVHVTCSPSLRSPGNYVPFFFSIQAPFFNTCSCTVLSKARTHKGQIFLDCMPNIDSDHGVFGSLLPRKDLIRKQCLTLRISLIFDFPLFAICLKLAGISGLLDLVAPVSSC